MKTRKSPSRLKTTLRPVVELARSLGELGYRRKLIEEELKTLDLRREDDEEEAAWLKEKVSATRTRTELLRHNDMLHALEERNKKCVHEHSLAEQESDQLGRLIIAVQEEMDEKISSLSKRFE